MQVSSLPPFLETYSLCHPSAAKSRPLFFFWVPLLFELFFSFVNFSTRASADCLTLEFEWQHTPMVNKRKDNPNPKIPPKGTATNIYRPITCLKSLGLFSVFWPILIKLYFGWSPLLFLFPILSIPLPILLWLYRAHRLQLVSLSSSCSMVFSAP